MLLASAIDVSEGDDAPLAFVGQALEGAMFYEQLPQI